MNRRVTLFFSCILFLCGSSAFAQNNGEVGVFADYFRFHNANDLNMLGVGGRVSFNVHPHVALEVEGAYDFERTATITVGGLTNPIRTNFRATHFLAGPQFTVGSRGPWRVYGTLKGGFVRFGVTPGAVTFGSFPTVLSNTDLNGVLYPGGGVEAFAGILGVRAEIGDEIYFDRGANNNLKITIGPVIRF
ncbi:MAG TPA: hypothetical protein VKZ53_04710 [Candidatus Angelobacter sp.]|nr:hypothetical protein [Candidatus Angelobacter sp.]